MSAVYMSLKLRWYIPLVTVVQSHMVELCRKSFPYSLFLVASSCLVPHIFQSGMTQSHHAFRRGHKWHEVLTELSLPAGYLISPTVPSSVEHKILFLFRPQQRWLRELKNEAKQMRFRELMSQCNYNLSSLPMWTGTYKLLRLPHVNKFSKFSFLLPNWIPSCAGV